MWKHGRGVKKQHKNITLHLLYTYIPALFLHFLQVHLNVQTTLREKLSLL